jgi:hypothetical protein
VFFGRRQQSLFSGKNSLWEPEYITCRDITRVTKIMCNSYNVGLLPENVKMSNQFLVLCLIFKAIITQKENGVDNMVF